MFIVQAVLIIGLPYALWRLRPVHAAVPLVVVQIIVGLALGPSLLGRLSPDLASLLVPASSLAALNGLSWIAVLFFAFLTGLHFDLADLHGNGRPFLVTSLSSLLVPAVFGGLAGLWLVDSVPAALGPQAEAFDFAFGMAICSAVTALPVLGAILREMHLLHDRLGVVALGCAAVNDAGLWVLAAVLLALSGGDGPLGVLLVMLASAAWLAAMIWTVRPLLFRLFGHAIRQQRVNERDIVVIASLLLLSALVTELIGIHYIIGAFVFGAVMPKEVAKDTLAKFESVVTVILLPFFFMTVGLRTSFSIDSADVLLVFGLMLAVNVAGKLAGAALPWRAFGQSWRDALALGGLVQCKGLMEIIVLTMLLERGIIAPLTFSAMVLVAVVTTAVTKPSVRLALRREQ